MAAAACDMNEISALLTGVEFWIDASDSAVADVSEGKFGSYAIPHAGLQTTGHPTFRMGAGCEMSVNSPVSIVYLLHCYTSS